MRRFVFALVATVTALIATLGAAETVLRLLDYPPASFSPWIADRATGFRFAADLHQRMRRAEYDVPVETNALGFRDDPVGAKAGFRILLLGDSFAAGYGVRRGEMFADLIEARLGVEVVNAAVGGWEIVHQVHFFADRGRRLRPDLVVYALYLGNDLTRNGEWREGEDGSLRSLERRYPVRPKHPVKLLELFGGVRYRMRERRAERRGEWVPFPDYLEVCRRRLGQEGKRDYAEVRRLLGRLAEEVRAAGAGLFVVTFPFRTAVEPEAAAAASRAIPGFTERYDPERPERETRRILAALGIPALHSGDALRERRRRDGRPLYFPIDGHLNAAGHRALADALALALRAWMPPGGADAAHVDLGAG